MNPLITGGMTELLQIPSRTLLFNWNVGVDASRMSVDEVFDAKGSFGLDAFIGFCCIRLVFNICSSRFLPDSKLNLGTSLLNWKK